MAGDRRSSLDGTRLLPFAGAAVDGADGDDSWVSRSRAMAEDSAGLSSLRAVDDMLLLRVSEYADLRLEWL